MRRGKRHIHAAAVLVLGLMACEQRAEIEVPPEEPEPGLRASALALPEERDLSKEPKALAATPIHVSEARIWDPCHVLFEEDGAPRARYPFQGDRERQAEALFGCEVEAFEELEDGRRLIAYALPARGLDVGPRDLRLAVYDGDGELSWSLRLNRSGKGAGFLSSLRGSFVADLPPHLICGGTMWEGSVQAICARAESGEAVWEGRLPYWTGIRPTPRDGSLFVADVTGLRRVYPWEGTEMRYRRLEGSGGRASFYATDGERLFFSSGRGDAPLTLIAYDLEQMKPLWSKKLPSKLTATWGRAFPEHELLVVHTDERVIGVDTTTGEARWVFGVGRDTPPVATSKDTLYLLVRRAKGPNLLHALDPRTGEHRWWGAPPTGTLRVAARDDVLLLGSVKAVQRASLPTPE